MADKAVVYTYVGEGLGVPGLAHEITQEKADAEGVGALLKECIALGVYVEQVEKPTGKVMSNGRPIL